jgi:hypothetical protein
LGPRQDDVAVRVAAGDDGGGLAIQIDAEKSLGLGGGLDGIDCRREGAVGAILEAQGHGEAGGHLPMGLRFGRAGADRGPADQIRNVLRSHRIEQLRCRRQPEIQDLAEKRPRQSQAGRDVVGAIEVRVHDQALPADGRPGLLKIDPHHDHDPIGNLVGEPRQAFGILAAGGHVVDRARTDDEEEAFVLGEDQAVDFLASLGDECRLGFRFRQFAEQVGRRGQEPGLDDIDIGSALHQEDGGGRKGGSLRNGAAENKPTAVGAPGRSTREGRPG